jgi:hypothetical protein
LTVNQKGTPMIQLVVTCGCKFRLQTSDRHSVDDVLDQASAHAHTTGHKISISGTLTSDTPVMSKSFARDRASLERSMLREALSKLEEPR